MSDKEEAPKQKPTRYKCKKCGNKITMYVKTLSPPTCNNPERHKGRPEVMEIIE